MSPPLPAEPSGGLRDPAALGWVAVTTTLVLFVLGLFVQLTDLGFGLWFTEIFLTLGTAWSLTRASGRKPWRYVRLDRPQPAPMVFGFLLGVVNYFAVVIPVQYLATSLAPKSWQVDESRIFQHAGPLELALIITGVSIAAPFCEETLFRGVFQQGLQSSVRRPIVAVVIAAAVFSGFHFDPVGFTARLELGILFGLLMLRYDSLWPGIMAHAANNLVPTAVYFASTGSAAASQQEPTAASVLVIGAWGWVGLLLLFAAARKLPSLAPRRHEPAPPPDLVHRPGIVQSARPWAFGALLALLGLLLVKGPRRRHPGHRLKGTGTASPRTPAPPSRR